MYLAAAVQLSSTSDAERNLSTVEALVARAAGYGARLVTTPENTNYLGPHKEKVRLAEPVDGPTISRLATCARTHGLHLLVGSFNERSEDASRCYNTSVLIGPDGSILSTYRKIHLFDVDHAPNVRFVESDTVVPGADAVVVATELGVIGLSICYDVRFAGLYQALVDKGAELIMVPAAFTATTGKAHWEPLLRARAIETQCWVIAPGQHGQHDDQGLRESHGHSMIVDPWGAVVGRASDGAGLALAEIDLDRVRRVRRAMPVQAHRRL